MTFITTKSQTKPTQDNTAEPPMMERNAPEDIPMMEQDTPLSDIQAEDAHSAAAKSAAIAPEDTPMMEQDALMSDAETGNGRTTASHGVRSSDHSSGSAENESGVEDPDTIALRKAVDRDC